MSTVIKKIPLALAGIFFAVAALVSMFKGAEVETAVLRGLVAGGVSIPFTWPLAYVLFSEKLPQATPPPGLEDLAKKFEAKESVPAAPAPAAPVKAKAPVPAK
ncbi:MAG: hypothetical protein HZA04_04750 [Nitrospinae bacterium]|nr:hypothetical protein [Nitrospinota bacterium]